MKGKHYDYKLLASIRDAKVTQEKFAEMLGVTIVTVSRMENGHGASYDLLLRACQALDIDSAKVVYSNRRLAVAT